MARLRYLPAHHLREYCGYALFLVAFIVGAVRDPITPLWWLVGLVIASGVITHQVKRNLRDLQAVQAAKPVPEPAND